MAVSELSKKLSSLVQLDIDAAHAYGQAIDKIDIPEVKQTLGTYKQDHEKHVDALSKIIRDMGDVPPEKGRDFKGFMIEGFTALMSLTGDKNAITAMENNEKLTNKKYSEALGWQELTPEAKLVVEGNYKDEQQHLSYIQKIISEKVWEKSHV
ncbi:MAG: DUF2383 domain-containing protein [Chitinivibrionales bacterium]